MQMRAKTNLTLYETIPDAVIVVGLDSSIVYANANAGRLFGYEQGEWVGLTIDSLLPEESRREWVQFAEKFFADPAPCPLRTGRELRASGGNHHRASGPTTATSWPWCATSGEPS